MCTFVLILIVLELTVPWTNLQVTLINPNVVKLGFIRVTIVEKISLSIHYITYIIVPHICKIHIGYIVTAPGDCRQH